MDNSALYPNYQALIDRKIRRLRDAGVSENNINDIIGFFAACKASGLSMARLSFYMDRLFNLALFVENKGFKDMDRNSINQFILKVQPGISANTYDAYIAALKKFYRHLYGLTSMDPAPDCVRHLKMAYPKTNIKKEDLLTSSEIEALKSAANSLMWKALICVLEETGARPGEVRALKFGVVTVGPNSIKLRIEIGKTAKKGGPRNVFVIRNYDIVKMYLDNCPNRYDKNAWVFSHKNSPFSAAGIICGVRRIARKAGINRRVNPYIFRHGVGTQLYKMNPIYAKRIMGHSADSSMSDVYCHMDDSDLEAKLLEMNGIDQEIEPKELFRQLAKLGRLNPERLIKMLEEEANRPQIK